METERIGKYQKKIFTVPNLLSLFRLLLVPLFCWTYLGLENGWFTAAVLALSGLTDLADGYIARRFDMISDVGKVLDPVADKVTQGAVLLCLLVRFPLMMPLFIILAVKEITDVITGGLVLKKTGKVLAAEWHGKAASSVLYVVMTLHVLWRDIPETLTLALVILCCTLLLLSLTLYTVRNIRTIRQHAAEAKKTETSEQPEQTDAPN